MDPLTQGLLGATAAQNLPGKTRSKVAIAALGFLSGMAADLDVLIRSNSDPLLFLEYHRHFTHSLAFIPFGGLLCGVVLYYLFAKRQLSLKESIGYSIAGYATHALLDACTTYGTQLLWPFSDARIAWNIISIIDPLYTLPILVLFLLALGSRRWPARVALFWALAYPLLGLWQHHRAEQAGLVLAEQRGDGAVNIDAKPSFGNLLVWKTIYRHQDTYYVDGVRVGQEALYYPGDTIPALNIDRDLPWLPADSKQAGDLQRFMHFSNHYLALDPEHPNRVIDLRYSLLPNEIDALWSIQLNPLAPEGHVYFQNHRGNPDSKLPVFKAMLMGKHTTP
ncbi:metal-dependent hydrolase [Spongiibacter sp. KMU-158]|uniref:Metal-dependent hydrolase n=1 Tax=Spongiibacter pelagi TaxID=2760804 RepID=A0A927GUY8_9GAMM|nr:metal-dependent hydrolase [Spongiibacter pelagi]MBD2858106.1 metal-dependent hydrolase [Spongiibacter pelagi]